MTTGVTVWDDVHNQVALNFKTPSGAYRHLLLKDFEMVYTDESYNTLWRVGA